MDNETLHAFGLLLGSLQREPSRTAKTALLTEQTTPAIAECFRAALDPHRRYYVTRDLLGALPEATGDGSGDASLAPFLEKLQARQGTREAFAKEMARITQTWSKVAVDAAWAIIHKDLEAGVDVKTVNPVLKKAGLSPIPEFSVALGEPYTGEAVWEQGDWYASRKLDGIRCVAICAAGKRPVFISRQGNEFNGLVKLAGPVIQLALRVRDVLRISDFVLDGELALRTEDGSDDFHAVQGALNRKNYDVPNPMLYAFDLLTLDEFSSGTSTRLFSERIAEFQTLLPDECEHLRRVKQKLVTGPEVVESGMAVAHDRGWEGLILRKDAQYVGKRSRDLYKVKESHDCELVVQSVEMGTKLIDGRVQNTLAAAFVEYKGHLVGVGSGWTDAQRLHYFASPDELIGAELTVAYTQESKDKDGKPSLRFPRVKAVHGSARSM